MFATPAFERADGIVFDDAPPLKDVYWKPPLFRDLGRLFARLHNRAQTYKVSNPRFKVVRARTAQIIERLKRLPTAPSTTG